MCDEIGNAELAIGTHEHEPAMQHEPAIDTCEEDDVRQTIDTCNMSP